MADMNCKKCKSEKLKKYKYLNVDCYVCHNCAYDSCVEIDEFPEQRTSQREKTRHSPYKAGGKKRTK